LDRYAAGLDQIPLPLYAEGELQGKPPYQTIDHGAAYGHRGGFPYQEMTPTDHRWIRAAYWAMCDLIDAQVGRLLAVLKETDQIDDTIVIFASDHGEMLGDHNLWRKTYAYEGSSNIPFFIVPPATMNRPARRIADEVVELRDIMPTLLDAAGVFIPPTVDGRSVLGLLDAPAQDWRTYIHGEHCMCYSTEQEMQYVTDGRRKFIWLPRINVEQFFDLEADPGECCNLIHAPDRQDEINRWRQYLIRELDQRQCGWVKNNTLTCPSDSPLISPYKNKRWQGK
jgi:arylsulfatase A-like enzyme